MTRVQATINAFLRRLASGYVDEVGIFADYLEEVQHPLAPKVRREYDKWEAGMAWCRLRTPRRGIAVWEECGRWHRAVRARIRTIFKRKWLPRSVQDMWDKNQQFLPKPVPKTAEVET